MESKMMPLISVIIPIYNIKEYLSKSIDSIINQTYKNIEIILVDDGSTDGSSKICDEYAEMDSRIRVIHKENGGVTSARKAGLLKATGTYVTYVDGDDWMERNAYSVMVEKGANLGADIVQACGIAEYPGGGNAVLTLPLSREYMQEIAWKRRF
jgi:glycosyltransferase involved in cell wall biosynthesis